MTLNGLPVELLEQITSYLPLSAAAALTIATRSTFSKLGTEYLWRINQQKRLRYTHWSDVMETPSDVSAITARKVPHLARKRPSWDVLLLSLWEPPRGEDDGI
jgi:hypothetical protein